MHNSVRLRYTPAERVERFHFSTGNGMVLFLSHLCAVTEDILLKGNNVFPLRSLLMLAVFLCVVICFFNVHNVSRAPRTYDVVYGLKVCTKCVVILVVFGH